MMADNNAKLINEIIMPGVYEDLHRQAVKK